MNRKIKDFSDPLLFRKIHNENVRLYERLQHIYEYGEKRSPLKSNFWFEHAFRKALYEQDKIRKKLIQEKKIQAENRRLLINLSNVKATKSLCKSYLDETHWRNFLVFKSRRFLSHNARILIAKR